jgi:hypothetical protein
MGRQQWRKSRGSLATGCCVPSLSPCLVAVGCLFFLTSLLRLTLVVEFDGCCVGAFLSWLAGSSAGWLTVNEEKENN